MDLYSMYLPDALSYTSFRSPVYYRDYERQPFEDKRKSCDYKERQQRASVQQPHQQPQHTHGNQQQRRESCPFCKEEKRRPLVAYLRAKSNSGQQDVITEEEQEPETEEDIRKSPAEEGKKSEVQK